MSITSYATLQTTITSWLHRDLGTTVTDLISFAETRIYRDLRIRCMETAIDDTIASGTIALPTRYRALKFAYVNATPVRKLERKDAEWIYHNYPTRSSDGVPKFIARQAETFIFGPYPDSAYDVKGVAYCALAPLSDSNTTNWFIENAPDLLLFAALCEAEPFMDNDARAATWDTKYSSIAARLQREDDAEEFSGSPLSATVR